MRHWLRCKTPGCGYRAEGWDDLAEHVHRAHGRGLSRGHRFLDGAVQVVTEFPVPMYCRLCGQTFLRKDQMGECRSRDGYHSLAPVKKTGPKDSDGAADQC